MKPIEDQLQEALARIQTLETDAQASANLLTDASAQTEAIRNQLTALVGERDRVITDLLSAQRSIESVTARNKELEAMEQDIEKRVAFRSAQVIAGTGTQVPAKISPAGDASASAASTTPEQHIAHYNDLIKRKQPKAAAEFYEKNIQPLFNH
jgi:hypothetical protein